MGFVVTTIQDVGLLQDAADRRERERLVWVRFYQGAQGSWNIDCDWSPANEADNGLDESRKRWEDKDD